MIFKTVKSLRFTVLNIISPKHIVMNEYDYCYLEKENFLTSQIYDNVFKEINDKAHDVVDMAYDYLDSLTPTQIMNDENHTTFNGFVEFIKANHAKYEINEWGERLNT